MIEIPAATWHGPRPQGDATATSWSLSSPRLRADEFDPQRRSSPWAGHRLFAFDLVRAIEPRLIVELGTHYGCSFFAFCDAVLDEGLGTELVAVDTWAGDEHAGFYSDVYELVADWTASNYSTIDARLLRTTFDEAALSFEPGTVDLLHIDGYHSYEAARHDYETWIDKLSDRATVLFHDVDPKSGYGSADYWAELAGIEGGFTFEHSFGLGVLTRDESLATFLSSDTFADLARYYAAASIADLRSMQVDDVEQMVRDQRSVMDHQDELIADRDAAIAAQAELIDAKQAVMEHQDGLVDERNDLIAVLTSEITDLRAAIDELRGANHVVVASEREIGA